MQMPSALAPGRIRPVRHDATLSVVDHLEELRSRLIVSLAALTVAFGICFWQNHELLKVINAPLAHNTQQQVRDGHGPLGATYTVQRSARDVAQQLGTVVGLLSAERQPAAVRTSLGRVQQSLQRDVKRLSAAPQGDRPVTLGIGEPFTTTLTVTLIFALILSLPVLLLQAYGFVMPAFEPWHAAANAAGHVSDPVPVHRRRHVRLPRGPARRAALLSELQQRRIQRTRPGQPVLQVRRHDPAGDGAAVPGSGGDHRRHPCRACDSQDSCATTAATRYWPAAWSPRCSRATRSRCCSRPCPCTCYSSSASWSRASPNGAPPRGWPDPSRTAPMQTATPSDDRFRGAHAVVGAGRPRGRCGSAGPVRT